MNKNKIFGKIIFATLIVFTIGFSLAYPSMFENFEGSTHANCHGSTNPGTGTVNLTSSIGSIALPNEVFTISAEVQSFVEGTNKNITIGFVQTRGNNDKFSFNPTQIDGIDLDGSGNSGVINFQVTAPLPWGNHTLTIDVLEGSEAKGDSTSFRWLSASVNIIVGIPSVLGAPIVDNVTKSIGNNTLELGESLSIQIDAIDNETSVDRVLLGFEGANHSLFNSIGNTYIYHNLTPTTPSTAIEGTPFVIFAFDTENKMNGAGGFIKVADTIDPNYSNYSQSSDTVEAGDTIDISLVATDYAGIQGVTISIESFEHQMGFVGSDTWTYELRAPNVNGILDYTITIEDNSGNTITIDDSVQVTGGISTGPGGANPIVFLLGSVTAVLVISLIGIALKKKKHFF